jgi:uncharacterized ion transporter superfamily protein YfcC
MHLGPTRSDVEQVWLVRRCARRHDDAVPQSRSIHLRRSQIIWLVAIVVIGVVVGVLAGAWWGLGAAAILLATSEVIERAQRTRNR